MEQLLEEKPVIEKAYVAYNKTKEAQNRIIVNAINSAVQEGKTNATIGMKGSDILEEVLLDLLNKKYYVNSNLYDIYISWGPERKSKNVF